MLQRTLKLVLLYLTTTGLLSPFVPQASNITHQDLKIIRIPAARELFGLSASPNAKGLLLYAVREPEDELTFGSVAWVGLSSPDVKFLRKLEGVPADSQAVWTSDGSAVYFNTTEGLYRFSPLTSHLAVVYAGENSGSALSPDGSKIAFWHHTENSYDLIVLDLKTHRKVREWQLPYVFGGEIAGFDMTFAADGGSVLSRTYDSEQSTPLKEFSIETGNVRTIVGDCYSVTKSNASVYFIQSMEDGKRALMKLSPKVSPPQIVVPDLQYETFLSSANPDWIVLQNPSARTIGFFDSRNESISDTVAGCGAATVLSNGQRLYANKNILSFGVQSCLRPDSPSKARKRQ